MDSARFDRHVEQIRRVLDKYQLFFVCGAPKSGTTWLQKSLDAHDQIVCAGEGHFFDKFAGSMKDLLKQYYLHQEVVAKNVYEGKPYYRHTPTNQFEFLAVSFILGAFANLQLPEGTKFIGDKTPASIYYLELLYFLFPKMKIVHIVRDGRDALASTFKHVERVSRNDQRLPDVDAFLLENTKKYSMRWVDALKMADAFANKHADIIHTVRYEDLKQDFARAFSNVLKFLGAASNNEAVAHCEAEASFKRLSGGRNAGEEDPNAFFRKGVVGDWQAGLKPQHLEIFYSVGTEWLTRFGYKC